MATHSPRAKNRTNVRFVSPKRTTVRALQALGEAFPETTARLALAAWSRPRRYEAPRRERYWRMGAVEFRIGRGTHGVRAWSWGEGPTVLLVHGWEGRGMQLGGFVKPLVDAGYRVVTWDAPAHGLSGGNRSSLFSFADTVLAAVRQVGPVHAVIAHSMGAAATLLALRTRFPLGRLALIGPGDPAAATASVAEHLGLGTQVAAAMRHQLRERYGVPLEEVAIEALARDLEVPTLVVHDEHDRYAPITIADRVQGVAPTATVLRTSGLGHHRILRDEDVLARVASFVADKPIDVPARRSLDLTQDDILRDLSYGRP